jgi:hypothetical protein
VDGGVLDNLPLDAVAEFLEKMSRAGIVARRPAVGPHVLLTASLEPRYRTLNDEQLKRVKSSWILLSNRVKQLRYNRKVDAFKSAQRHFRALYKQGGGNGWIPVDLEVASVKPMWLTNTFGFHPMLGVRRVRQAESIAHGCASTFVKLHALFYPEPEKDRLWSTQPWPIRLDTDPKAMIWDRGNDERIPVPQQRNPATGRCWFRTDSLCPFSPMAMSQRHMFERDADKPIRDELAMIYLRCGDPWVQARRASSETSLQGNGTGAPPEA